MYVFYACIRTARLEPSVPRRVFTWFLATHNVCMGVGVAGYVCFLLEMLGARPVVELVLGKGGSFNLLLYGLYFGVLGRDVAELASTCLVRRPTGPPAACASCGCTRGASGANLAAFVPGGRAGRQTAARAHAGRDHVVWPKARRQPARVRALHQESRRPLARRRRKARRGNNSIAVQAFISRALY